MPIARLDHVNLRTTRLQEMITWYEDVLGLKNGPRPNFPFPGAWLYADDHAVVHLVEHSGEPGTGGESDLKLEHFAFSASNQAGFEATLREAGQTFDVMPVRDAGMVQFHVRDPDGNHVHVDFTASA